jgi:hypothetical protein
VYEEDVYSGELNNFLQGLELLFSKLNEMGLKDDVKGGERLPKLLEYSSEE